MKMIRKTMWILAILALAVVSVSALADEGEGWQIDPALMYMIWNQSGSPTVTTSRFLGDLTIGYQFSSPIFLGATYDYDDVSTSGGGSSSSTTYQDFGPTIGVMASNVYLTFTYYVSTQRVNNPGTTDSGTSGYQVNLGYQWQMGSWSVGPQLSYRSLNFSTGTSPVNTLLPYVAFQFHI